jgi:hypothetical protein
MYFIGLFLIIFKGLIFYLDKLFLSYLSLNSLLFLLFLLIYLTILYKNKKKTKDYYKNLIINPKENNALVDHIMTYRCKSNLSILVWFYILALLAFLYFIGILSLRIRNIENIIDIKKIGNNLLNFYYNSSISLLFFNFLILLLLIISFLWTIGLIKKYLLKKVMSLHFYLAEEKSYYYKKINKLAFSNLLYQIYLFINLHFSEVFRYIGILFFLKKINITFSRKLYGGLYESLEMDLTEDDNEKLDLYYKKYGYICDFFNKALNFILYNLHYLLLFFIIFYDIFYNNMILKNFTYYLPFMFLYHSYVIYCKFVIDKKPYGLVSFVNKMFYHDVIVINKLMLIDGEPFEVDTEFGIDFLNYELRNFTEPNK